MKRFTKAIEASISEKNWYSALTLALTMPDICGKLEAPKRGSGERYEDWWNRYMAMHYVSTDWKTGATSTYLPSGDAYALRCSYLHEGGSDISLQRARVALDNFHFVFPREGYNIHCNKIGSVLQIQVDVFAHQICAAVIQWDQDTASDADISERKQSLLTIHDIASGIPGVLVFG